MHSFIDLFLTISCTKHFRYVHHMMLYECHDSNPEVAFTPHVDSRLGYECYTPNMPDDFLKCRGIVAAWGLGGEPFYFPPDAGYPLGEEHGGSTYYMLEVELTINSPLLYIGRGIIIVLRVKPLRGPFQGVLHENRDF